MMSSPPCHLVELGETGADALDATARIEKCVQTARIILDDVERGHQPLFRARFAQLEQRLFGPGEDVRGVFFARQRAVHQMLRGDGDPAKNRLVPNDPGVAVEIGNLRQSVVERDQIAEPVHRFQFAETEQFVRHRHAVDLFVARVQFAHPPEDAAVLFEREILLHDHAGDFDETGIVQHHGAENKALGVYVDRQTSFEGGMLHRGSGVHGHGRGRTLQ